MEENGQTKAVYSQERQHTQKETYKNMESQTEKRDLGYRIDALLVVVGKKKKIEESSGFIVVQHEIETKTLSFFLIFKLSILLPLFLVL